MEKMILKGLKINTGEPERLIRSCSVNLGQKTVYGGFRKRLMTA
ncbi:MAG: hypothetical protein PHF18_14600 [Methanosarcina sp.]|nr:hypothetical protein [Methanosarcina sp.]MDD3248059.1 hypothetical protein [Methanosarcina sp.]MDD4249207.1 hypothetical protein [Methanosarcina sp.]